VLFWSHYDQTGPLVARLTERTQGWATVLRAPFETQGADVREL
jgi:homoserine kinase